MTGAYRYVRNPMYVAVLGAIVGQALLLGQPSFSWVRGAGRDRGDELRPPVRGAGAPPAVRRGVRGVPARGPRVGAAARPWSVPIGCPRAPAPRDGTGPGRQTPLVPLSPCMQRTQWRRGPTRSPTQRRCSAPPRRGSSSSSRRGSPRRVASLRRPGARALTFQDLVLLRNAKRLVDQAIAPARVADALRQARARHPTHRPVSALTLEAAGQQIVLRDGVGPRRRRFGPGAPRPGRRAVRTGGGAPDVDALSPRLSPSRIGPRHGPACCTPSSSPARPGMPTRT